MARGDEDGFSDLDAARERQRRVWLDAIAREDETAFAQLYQEVLALVRGYLHLHIQNDADAAEALQDTFVAIWQGADHYEGRCSVSTWILGIARNKVRDVYRAEHRRRDREIAGPEGLDRLLQVSDSGSESAEVITRVALDQTLSRLSEETRDLAYAVFVAGMSYEDVARFLRVPEGTVKSRVFHLRKVLRKSFKEGE